MISTTDINWYIKNDIRRNNCKNFFLTINHISLLFININYGRFNFKLNYFILLSILFIFFVIIFSLNLFFWNNFYKTFYIFNASLLTLLYFEISIILEKKFFRHTLGSALPYLIILMISVTVMMNAAYFNLLLIYNIFK